jgi:hypothetical protein
MPGDYFVIRRMRYRECSKSPVGSTHFHGHATIHQIIFICRMQPDNNEATQMLLSVAIFMTFLRVGRKKLQNSAEYNDSRSHILWWSGVLPLWKEQKSYTVIITNTSAEFHFSFIFEAPNVNGCKIIKKVNVILNFQSVAKLMPLIVHNRYWQ